MLMFRKLSLRWRLTLMSAGLIGICSIMLTLVLNYSAYQLANSIEAAATTPAYNIGETIPAEELAMPLERQDNVQAKREYGTDSIYYTMFAVFIGSILTYYVVGRALQPVKKLNEQVKNVNVNNLSESLEVPETKDEIADLTKSFNEMSNQLYDAFSMQKRFSINAAHELRTPLTVLQTKLDVFQKKDTRTQEEYNAFIAAIQKQTSRLRDLIKNVLDLTNLEEGESQSIRAGDLFEDIYDDLQCLAEEKKVELSIDGGQQAIWGNPELLYRAFYNLVENAIKYNVIGGKVEVVIEQDHDHDTIVYIKDNGIGIPQHMNEQIFEPFYRVDDARSHHVGGAGLGLSLVDAIIKKQHGNIEIINLKPIGTCFKITFHTKNK